MALKTVQEYKDSLQDGRVVYYDGERVEDVTEHPALRVAFLDCAMDYHLAHDPRYKDLLTTTNEDGELVHFVFVPPRSAADLLRRREIIQTLARICLGTPGGAQFTGIDGLNALTVVTQRVDKHTGSHYSERLNAYRKYLQQNDCGVALAMTDPKGDRSLRPAEQAHPDYYLRIVDRRKDGIVVRGAKMHISFSPVVHEMIVLPTRNMREDERDYAVSFTIPVNTKGITLISNPRDGEEGNLFEHPVHSRLYGADALVIFDDVFVPYERVFLDGEWQFAGQMAYVFADFHRVSADSYKYPALELLAGTAMLMAEYNGLEKVSHVNEKLSWLVAYAEETDALGKVACEHCITDPDSDWVYPNPMYSNLGKLHFANNIHQAIKHMQDIAGGAVVTIPSSRDLLNPALRPLIERYCGGKAGTSAEHRMRALKLVKDLSSVEEQVVSIHAEGSLAAQHLSILALADSKKFKAAAKRACGIEDGSSHPLYSGLPQFPLPITKQ